MGEVMMILALALALLGLGLVFMEFFLPTGFLIIMAILFLLGSIIAFNFLGIGIGWTVVYGIAIALATLGVIAIALGRIRRRVALKEDQKGFQAAELSLGYIGQNGIVISDLKPSGYIRIGDDQFHAMTDRGYVNKGTSVQVMDIRGATLIVKVLK